jgi:alpha-beta hydrolase superfamily lysophospholipase
MKEFSLPSQHGKLRGVVWDEVTNPIGTVQIIHGLVEYHGRYQETAEYLNKNGFIVFCNDHLGHGLNITDGNLKGFFKEEDGYEAVVDQLGEMNSHIRKNYPMSKHFVLSHSLGTALVISLLKRNIYFDGVLMSAAFSVSNIMIYLNKILLLPEFLFQGKKSTSLEMEKFTTQKHNSFYEPNRTTHDYLSSDKEKVDEYIADQLCGYPNTTQLWQDLSTGFINLWTKKTFSKIDNNIPFYLITGDQDKVNNDGKQAEDIHGLLIEYGFKSELEIFKGIRHEPFQEKQRQKVFESVLNFYLSNL